MRARYYDPQVGRFISKDPIGYQGGINLFGYVANNPINYIDPQGEGAYSAARCYQYASEFSKAIDECERECGGPEDLEKGVDYIIKYSPNNSLWLANRNCVCSKMGEGKKDWMGMNDCHKLISYCIKMFIWRFRLR
jgi:uncharacterized protein RhaS with RHS repeats